jgi:hypothetical protein
LAYAPGAGEFGSLGPVDPIEEVLVKDRSTHRSGAACRAQALRALIPTRSRRVEAPLSGALLMAHVEQEARDLCGQLVRDARDQHGLTWAQIGAAFGITMQSAQWRFSRPPRQTTTRIRR